jgi:two-component system alkaline phosphatase synthesis response regulator PhoP
MDKILVVEDEPAVAMGLTYALADEGYSVQLAKTGQEALHQTAMEAPDLFLLDLRLPDMDGLEVCRELRSRGCRQPILMLTARDTTRDKVEGLEAGAVTPGTSFRVGPFEIDLVQQRVERDGQECQLTATEFRLLSYMAQSPGQVFTRDELIEAVWGYDDFYGDPRTVDVHIRHLRQKLEEDPNRPQYIVTVRGFGYRLQVEPD